MKRGCNLRAALTAFLCAALWVYPYTASANDSSAPSSVDVYWNSTRTVVVPGVTTVVVLDEQIAQAQIGNDTIEFAGLTRGDTVALAYVKGAPLSIVVHVINRPTKVIPPGLLQRESELGRGVIGSDVQMSSSPTSSGYVVVDSLSWEQSIGDHRFSAISQFENNDQLGAHNVNLRSGSVIYTTPNLTLNLLDFSQALTGELGEDRLNNFSPSISAGLRGAGLTLNSGKNEFAVFGGSTIPFYFLSLNATRDVAGFTFHRRQTNRLNLFGGTNYVNIPVTFGATLPVRRNYGVQTAGVTYRVGKGLLIGAQGGISNAGGLGQADVSYASYRMSAYATALSTSQTFPLTQLQSLFSGTSDVKAGFSYKLTSRLTQGLYYDHTTISPGLVYRFKGKSDYLSPNWSYQINRSETINFSYTYSRSSGGFTTAATTGNRYDGSLNSIFREHIANSAEIAVGSIQDPLGTNSADQLTLRDAISLPVKGQTILLGVEHDRVQPSIIAKLNQEISLLSPVLQAEFLANPLGFIDSTNFPPEVKALLQAEQPTGTTFSGSTMLSVGPRLHFNPSVSLTRATDGPQANTWSQSLGYSLVFQFRPTLQLRSSLSNVLLFDSRQSSTVRTTVLGFGVQKSFAAAPTELSLFHRARIVEGRVFRDNNINGSFNAGEPGLPGIEVRLDDGQVAITDELGRYKFPSVSADQHEVSIALTQFRNPVRMTTRSVTDIDLIQQRVAVVNFGLLDFARLMGNVYNDLRFDNVRQPDSKGMENIQLVLDDGKQVRKIQTQGSGDFELDNVPPGDYKLSLDAASIPPNYLAPVDSVAVHVSPVSTVVQDIPVRALRSISGTVLLKTMVPSQSASVPSDRRRARALKEGSQPVPTPPSQEFKLVPVAGVQIAAGASTATTDADGKFLLRNLPAGELKVTVTPVKPFPPGMNIPSGAVKLPAEPVQIQGATIVITNSDLLHYLTREVHDGTESRTADSVAATSVPHVEAKPVAPVASPAAKPILEPATKPTSSSVERPEEPEPTPAGAQPVSVPTIPPTPLAVRQPVEAKATAAPPIPQLVPRANASNVAATTAPDGVLTREVCNQLPSLGEIAQCLRQLRLNNSNPK